MDGTPQCKFLSIESGENANAEEIKKCINKAFERIGITNFSKKLLGLKSYKRIREAYNITVPKPANAHGSRWLDHKIRAMLIALESYGILLNHIESLS